MARIHATAVLLLSTLCSTVLSSAARAQERVAGWSSALDHWLAALEREHYVCRAHGVPDALLERADWLREELPRLSDARTLIEFQRLASLAGDGHTYVLPFSPRSATTALPLRFYFF